MDLKVHKRGIFLLIAVMALELATVIGYYAHQRGAIGRLETRYQQKKVELDQARLQDGQLVTAQQTLSDEQAQLGHLEGALTTHEYVPTLLVQLQKLATGTHNQILSIKPSPPAPPPPPPANPAGADAAPAAPAPAPLYDKYDVEMDVQGEYKSVMAFLMQLTQFPKIVEVDKFQMTSQPPNLTGPTLVTAILKCTAYILKDN